MGDVTLTEFLLARIAEDEESMRGVLALDARTERDPDDFGKYVIDPVIGPYGGQSPLRDVARGLHLARFGNPNRVLAECEAKRRVVERLAELTSDARPQSPLDDEGWDLACWETLADLALPYAEHPDYRKEWRP